MNCTNMNLDQFINFFCEIVKESFIKTYGVEKWNSLSDKQKHDVVMVLAKDFQKGI